MTEKNWRALNGILLRYDALDHLIKVTDPKGLNTTTTVNALGDVTQLTSPDTGTTTYTYDSAGNRATQTDARGVTTSRQPDSPKNRIIRGIIKMTRMTITLVLLLMMASNAFGSENDKPDIVRAIEIAGKDFVRRMSNDVGSDREWGFIADLNSYNIGVSSNRDYFLVLFVLKRRDEKINGGGAEYLIRKGDYKIVKFTGYE